MAKSDVSINLLQEIITNAEALLVADAKYFHQLGFDAEKLRHFRQLQLQALHMAEDTIDKEISQRKDWPLEIQQEAQQRIDYREQHRAQRGVKKQRGAK
jgi:glycyl-tRNA synthetase (class II)